MSRRPTCDLQLLPADLTLQVETPPPLSVISSTQAGHIHNTLIMDVHVAGCRDKEREEIKDIRKILIYVDKD